MFVEKLKIACQKHLTKNINDIMFLSFDEKEQENNLMCNHCINESSTPLNGFQMINIREFAVEGEDLILNNWPPLLNEKSLASKNQIRAKIQQHMYTDDKMNDIEELSTQIQTIIATLQTEITEKIKDWEKQIQIKLGLLSSVQKQFTVFSYGLCQRDKVSRLLKEYESNPNESILKIHSFIQEIKLKSKENTEKLEGFMKDNEDIFSLDILGNVKKTKQAINHMFDNIFDKESIKNQQNKPNNIIGKEIYQLIANKFNFCKKEFLKNVEEKIDQLHLIFSDISLQDMYLQEKGEAKLSNLNEKQIDDLQSLVNQMVKQRQQSDHHPITQYFIDTITENKNQIQMNNFSLEIIQQLQSYPIFSNIEISQPMQWILSHYLSSSNDLKRGIKNINQPYIKRINVNSTATAYLNKVLLPENKYQVHLKIKFYDENNKNLFIGLIRSSQKDIIALHREELCFTTFPEFKNSYGVTKQIIGLHISEIIKIYELKEIDVMLQIHIQKEIFYVYDYPNKQSIYSIIDNSNLRNYGNNSNLRNQEDLYLAYESNAKNQLGQEVTLISFKQVDEFDEL